MVNSRFQISTSAEHRRLGFGSQGISVKDSCYAETCMGGQPRRGASGSSGISTTVTFRNGSGNRHATMLAKNAVKASGLETEDEANSAGNQLIILDDRAVGDVTRKEIAAQRPQNAPVVVDLIAG